MTPDQQKEKARVVAVVAAADDDVSSASSPSTALEAPSSSAPPLSAARTKTSLLNDSRSSKDKQRLSSVFAAGAALASSASGARAASSAAADALRFYAQTLPTSLVFVAFMFGLYAATSYGLPHVLCKSSATDETIVDNYTSFVRCVYNRDKDYSTDRARKIFFVFYQACLLTWLVVAPLVNGLAMWPRTTRGRPALLGALAVAGCMAVALAAPGLELSLNSNHYYFTVPFLFGFSVNLVIGRALARATGDPIDQARFFAIELFAGIVSLVFTLFMQRVVTRRAFSKPLQLLGTRLIFHTGVWDAVDLAFTHLSRYIVSASAGAGLLRTPAMSLSVLFVWPSMYRGVYGRFLLSQLDTAGNVAVLNVALAFLGLALRVCVRPAGGALLSGMYGARAAAGAEAAGAMGEVRAAKRYMDFLAEITGIVCAASVYTFGVVSPDGVSKYPIKGIWLSALYQAITTFVAEGIALIVDAVFHGIDYRKSWPLTRRGALTFLGWLLLIAFVGGSRICFDILLLFCPSVNAEGKAMMSFCNVPSLFDRI